MSLSTSQTCRRLAALLPLVLLCSCKGIPLRTEASNKQPPAHVVANDNAASAAPNSSVRQARGLPRYPVQQVQYAPLTLPPEAWTGQQVPAGGMHMHAPGQSCPHCGPGKMPEFQFSPGHGNEVGMSWVPDGIKCPWPKDEFICDGGDLNGDVRVKRDWTVVGLDQEDTVAHYDTVDGKTEVTASNCVCIYAPRFAAVRQISTPIIYEGHERMAGVEKPTRVVIHEEQRGPRTALQPEQLVAQIGLDQPQRLRERTQGLLVEQATRLVLAAEAFLPYENLMLIQRGEFDASEKARLAERVAAAVTWTDNQAVQILIDGKPAVEARGTSTPEVTYTYETGGEPCLRLCKIADKGEAKQGEIIQFTLRFDNVGEQKIGNVTIIDNLMPRLEYVAGSAQSTLKANFGTQEQLPGESLVLRWEIEEPLEVNQGGIIRFQARVR